MTFSDYYDALPRGEKKRLADALGLASTFVGSIAKGRRPLPVRLWAAVVRESAGAVTLNDLASGAEARAAVAAAPRTLGDSGRRAEGVTA